MRENVIRIERVSPRKGAAETPQVSARGYCLGDPKFGSKKHLARHAVFVKTLNEAAELISLGYSLRMTGEGKRASLVAPGSLKIIRG